MFIKDGVYREIDVKVDAPIAEGTILTFGGTLAAEDASDAFGIVPENIYVLPPTKKTRVVIGGTIDLDDPANKGVEFSEAVVNALGADINFVPAAEGGGGGESGVQMLELITQDNAPLPPEGVTPIDYKLSVVDAYDESVVTGDVYCLSGGRPAYIPSFIKGRKGIGPAYVMSGNASPVATDVNKNYGLTIKSEMSVLFISDNSGFIGFGVSKDDLIWDRVKER